MVTLFLDLFDIHASSLVSVNYLELATEEQGEEDKNCGDTSPSDNGQKSQKMPRHLQ